MNWINKVFLLAAGLTFAMTLVNYAFGFGWLSLIAAIPIFVAVSVLVAFFLVVRDRRLAVERRRREGQRRKVPKRRIRPAPALNGVVAPSAERGGRVLATLPAAPHSVHTV
jgi:Zn-dependent protease with chaperone function